ncbi:hypothetical protein HS041_27275 [Planomonospora sp. ID67723]|uniref:hypothetical protein n=1 Tax=Planomonospora sp. ID67723 TaxID=2738134 RepID=UPI0018C3BC95|nr:hypothetical protein [Planomonospora sp. ID67723]MBG0831453.1 hypothetical protein [Planomonospora sp. ID67723]
MTLEDQLAALARIGIALAPGRTVQELLHSFPRESYEGEPFTLLLFVLGIEVEAEPWGRRFCDRVWNFDTECVEGPGAYVEIARQLCRIAGRPDALTDVRDHVDLATGQAWIEYTAGGRRRHWSVDVVDDWADPQIVSYLMQELEADGRCFHAMDNGQASVLMLLSEEEARRLNELIGEELIVPAVPA